MSRQLTPKRDKKSFDVTPEAWAIFSRMLMEREQEGIKTYGCTLHTFNGRDPMRDLLEEIVDAFQYAVQVKMELEAEQKIVEEKADVINAVIVAAANIWNERGGGEERRERRMEELGIALHHMTKIGGE